MSLLGNKLIKLFGGDDVYLGKVEPSEVPKAKELKYFNIFESISAAFQMLNECVNPFQIIFKRKKAREEEEERQQTLRTIRHQKIIQKVKQNRNNTGYQAQAKQKWDDNLQRPDLSIGRQYLDNIKRSIVLHKASPSQITETLIRDTFRKKNFSENNITTLWGDYNQWLRGYASNGLSRKIRR